MRRQINSLKDIPSNILYSWKCIALLTEFNTFEIQVVQDESVKLLIRYLILVLQSTDGQRGSLEEKVYKKLEKIYIQNSKKLGDQQLENLIEQKKAKYDLILFKHTFMKYQMMLVRHKISFMAFCKQMTI